MRRFRGLQLKNPDLKEGKEEALREYSKDKRRRRRRRHRHIASRRSIRDELPKQVTQARVRSGKRVQ